MTGNPPEPARPGRSWALWIALVPAVLIALRWVLVEHERSIRHFSPGCVFNRLTGLHCPGCGATRAVFALAKGDVSSAWSMNPLLLLGVGAGLFYFVVALAAKRPGANPDGMPWAQLSPRGVWGIAIGVVLFGVLRNLPWWPFTLLAPH